MFEETKSEIAKTRGRIANLERRTKELEVEVATLPTRGYHRMKYLEARRTLKKVRKALEAEQEGLESLIALGESEAEMQEIMSPEQIADWKKFEAEQEAERKDRERRWQEANKRREAFRVIDGGKA
jgi:hypothetical protein